MNQDEKQGRLLAKYNRTADPYPPSRAMDWRRAGEGLPEVMLNGQDLFHHSLLAGRHEEEEEDGLTGRFVLSRHLASLDGLTVQKERDSIKQEFEQPNTVMQIKKEGNELYGFQDKKRRQHPPAKVLTMNENGLLGLQISRPHACEHCRATFRTSYHLQRHAFIHTGEKPFQCSQCDMRFIQKYLLQRHEKIHTGEKPFRCDDCGMKFIQKYHMERHRRTHSGEKPYQCCHCQQHFSRTDRVLKHQRMCHENRRTNQMNANDALAVSEQNLAFSSLPQDYSQPKKKRHKPREKPVSLQKQSEKAEGREDGPIRRECLSLASNTPNVKNEYERTDCLMELPDVAAGGSYLAREPASEINQSQEVILKNLSSKKSQRKPTGPHDVVSPFASFGVVKVSQYGFQFRDKPGFPGTESHTNLDATAVDAQQRAPIKLSASSASYDDAMQFLKKRRYLQPGVASSARDLAIDTQASASQSAGSRISSDVTTTCVSHSRTTKAEIKSIQDKNILSDEVLQTLIDHYSNEASGQPEVCFGVAGTEVTSSVSVNSSKVCVDSHVKAMGMNVPAPPSGNASMLQEYSKFLQQALERTSQNDSYMNTHSLPFVPKGQSLSNQPRFSATDTYYSSPSRLPSRLNPSLSLSSKKSQFGLLVGDPQHSFSCSGEETNPSSVSSTDDFLDQVIPPKKSDSSVIGPAFQMGAFEQNFHSPFQSCGSGVSSLFSFSSGAINLDRHESCTDFSEYPLASLADTRTRPASSLDSTDSQIYG